MPTLTNTKHELFAQNLAKGMGVHDSYLNAGYTGTPQAATAVSKNPRVAARVKELIDQRYKNEEKANEKAIAKIALTKEYVLTRLMENVERAMQAVPATKDGAVYRYEGSVANRALELLGKELGLFIDRKEVGAPGEFADADARTLREAIAQRLGVAGKGDTAAEFLGREGSMRVESSKLH